VKLIYRVHVGNRYVEVSGLLQFEMLLHDLIRGTSKLQKQPIKPEAIRVTVLEAAPEPEAIFWREENSSSPAV
jgi:hypothetical protein